MRASIHTPIQAQDAGSKRRPCAAKCDGGQQFGQAARVYGACSQSGVAMRLGRVEAGGRRRQARSSPILEHLQERNGRRAT